MDRVTVVRPDLVIGDPLVSFVIPQKGRLDLLELTLRSISRLTAPPPGSLTIPAFTLAPVVSSDRESPLDSAEEPTDRNDIVVGEVIVLTQDTDPTDIDRVLESVFTYSLESSTAPVSWSATRVQVDADRTISASRNLGAKLAGGEWLVFLDADVALSDNWLVAMLEESQIDDSRAIVSAAQSEPERPTALERVRVELSNVLVDCAVDYLPGRNLMLRRGLFDATGGFDEQLETCEDYEFTARARRFGGLYYSSAAGYVHLGEDRELAPMFVKELWRGGSNLSSLSRRNVEWQELPSFVAPFMVLGGLLVALVAPPIGNPVVALLGVVVMLVPVSLWSVRLMRAARGRLALFNVVAFYGVYFPARALGMLIGLRNLLRKEGR